MFALVHLQDCKRKTHSFFFVFVKLEYTLSVVTYNYYNGVSIQLKEWKVLSYQDILDVVDKSGVLLDYHMVKVVQHNKSGLPVIYHSYNFQNCSIFTRSLTLYLLGFF